MTGFSANLRARVLALGLTQADVARRLKLDPRRVGHYMTGFREPDFQTLVRLARSLNTSTDALLGLSDPTYTVRAEDKLRSQISAVCSTLDKRQLEIVLALSEAILDLGNDQSADAGRAAARKAK